MLRRTAQEADRAALREVVVTVVSFDAASRSYTVRYRGAEVGPVWSANGVLHAAGRQVRALLDPATGVIVAVVP